MLLGRRPMSVAARLADRIPQWLTAFRRAEIDFPVEPCRPKLRGTDERFWLQLLRIGVTRTAALEALVFSA